jgi:hypothetical protein
VDEDWCVACFHIVGVVAACLRGEYVEVVVVVAGDGEVPHPAVVVSRGRTSLRYRILTVQGLEVLALLELAGGNPLVQVRSVDWTNGFWVINLRTLRDGGDYGRVP